MAPAAVQRWWPRERTPEKRSPAYTAIGRVLPVFHTESEQSCSGSHSLTGRIAVWAPDRLDRINRPVLTALSAAQLLLGTRAHRHTCAPIAQSIEYSASPLRDLPSALNS